MYAFKSLIIIFFGLALAACASTSGSKVSEKELESIEKGKTTYAQVIERLGEPQTRKTTSQGKILVYSYSEARSDLMSYIPYAGGLLGKTEGEYQVINIFFDNNDVVREIQVEKGASQSGSSL